MNWYHNAIAIVKYFGHNNRDFWSDKNKDLALSFTLVQYE